MAKTTRRKGWWWVTYGKRDTTGLTALKKKMRPGDEIKRGTRRKFGQDLPVYFLWRKK